MLHGPILIYGANGRAGTLVRRLAAERGVPLIIAGRNADAIERAARENGLEARVFGLETPSTIDACLDGVHTVLHCAGPFRETAMPMFEACLRTRVQYVDINNDFEVVEALKARSDEAASRGVMALPCVGFTGVPADALAVWAAHLVPAPTRLDIVHCQVESPHPGTHGTNHAARVFVREDHRLKAVRNGSRARRFSCGAEGGHDMLMTAVTGPELTLAHESTGIADISVWAPVSRAELIAMRTVGLLGGQSLIGHAKKFLARIEPYVPRAKITAKTTARIAERPLSAAAEVIAIAAFVRNARDGLAAVRLETLDRDTMTAHAALQVAMRVAAGQVRPGFQTVAALFGADFVLSLPGVKRHRFV